MIACFHDNDVCHEVGTEHHAQGIDAMFTFGSISRQADFRELLLWPQHDKIWAENDAGVPVLVVEHLHRRIVWDSKGDCACFVPTRLEVLDGLFVTASGCNKGLAKALLLQQVLNVRWQDFFPQFFCRLQHVSLANLQANKSCGMISYVDSFVFVQRNCLAFLQDGHLHRRCVFTGPVNHPRFASSTPPFVGKRLWHVIGAEQIGRSGVHKFVVTSHEQCLVFTEDVDFFDAVAQRFSWLQEELLLTLSQLLSADVLFSFDVRVEDNTKLPVGQHCNVDMRNQGLVHIDEMGFCHVRRYQPFAASLAFDTVYISECGVCT
mmetsp:Transcript_47047/g.69700  ORF Transcript_47047/g.69700 Transcript_47047/m.69700 type:complete len:320 (+) Transcript_47047:2730-3689(+)